MICINLNCNNCSVSLNSFCLFKTLPSALIAYCTSYLFCISTPTIASKNILEIVPVEIRIGKTILHFPLRDSLFSYLQCCQTQFPLPGLPLMSPNGFSS